MFLHVASIISAPSWSCEESTVVHSTPFASLKLLSVHLHSLFPPLCSFTPHPLLSVSCSQFISAVFFFPEFFHQCRRTSPSHRAIMSMFTKGLIHQNKERQGEQGRTMDDKEKEREREMLECTLEWLWTVNPYSVLPPGCIFPNSLLGYFWVPFLNGRWVGVNAEKKWKGGGNGGVCAAGWEGGVSIWPCRGSE